MLSFLKKLNMSKTLTIIIILIIILIIISSLFAIPLYKKQKGNNSNFLKVISKWSEVILFLLFIIPSYWLIQFFLALSTIFISNWYHLYNKFYVIITIICLILAVFTTWLLSKVYSLLKSKIKVCDWKYNLICFMELFSLRNNLFFIITTTYFIWLILLWVNMCIFLALGWWAN